MATVEDLLSQLEQWLCSRLCDRGVWFRFPSGTECPHVCIAFPCPVYYYYYYIISFQLRTAAFKAYCAILVAHSNFRHQASPRVLPSESTQRRKVELWARNVWQFCLNANLYVTFRHLLHAVKLRHGTDGFTSPFSPKEEVLRIFSL